MSQVHRICPHCGGNVPLEARHCPTCGADTWAGPPATRSGLPAQVGRAALPLVAGLTGLALRFGWRLLQARLARLNPLETRARAARPPAPRPARGRRVLRIRSSWAIGDANGIWRQGHEEHIIEIDDE